MMAKPPDGVKETPEFVAFFKGLGKKKLSV